MRTSPAQSGPQEGHLRGRVPRPRREPGGTVGFRAASSTRPSHKCPCCPSLAGPSTWNLPPSLPRHFCCLVFSTRPATQVSHVRAHAHPYTPTHAPTHAHRQANAELSAARKGLRTLAGCPPISWHLNCLSVQGSRSPTFSLRVLPLY